MEPVVHGATDALHRKIQSPDWGRHPVWGEHDESKGDTSWVTVGPDANLWFIDDQAPARSAVEIMPDGTITDSVPIEGPGAQW